MPVPENIARSSFVLDNTCFSDFQIVANELSAVRAFISDEIAGTSESISEILEYVVARPGKLMRPAMVMLAGKSCSRTNEAHTMIAAIFEMMHIATLLHDDVIDEADSRRNAETVNFRWGNECAILSGDLLLSKVFAMSCRLDSKKYSEVIADTAAKICHGELRQNTQRSNFQLSETEYLEIIEEKTAVLFESCCKLGASASGATDKQVEALSAYGLNIGIAFQITDDLMDIVGDETKAGKTLGSDFSKDKLTLPVIHLLKNSSSDQRDLLEKRLTSNSESRHSLAELLSSSGSIDYARNAGQTFCRKAVESLDGINDSQPKDILIKIADSIAERC
jgi:octaprenyl-diphosphate synthase